MTIFRKLLYTLLLLFSGIYSWAQVSANFTANPSSGCAPLIVSFQNSSTNATSYSWTFGNTSTSALQNPSTSYLNPGVYTVTLTAHNGGDVSTKTQTITVYAPPVVSFVANDTIVCQGVAVTFTNTSNPNAPGTSTYNWNFGDGTSSSASSPSHVFPGPGYYNISLTLTNSYGCVSTLTMSSYIHVLPHPVANFSVSNPYICHAPGQVTFTNTSSGPGPMTSQWYFGDGGSSLLNNPTHPYTSSGSYNVTLIVTDANGCVDSVTHNGAVTVGNLTAGFTAPSTACVYSNVTFTNTSNQTSNILYNWSFGDGWTSFFASPTHQYTAAGNYSVRLIIYNGICNDTVTHSITILPEPAANFTYTPAQPCPAPITIQFNPTAPPGSTYVWDFGDASSISTSANPSHPYSTSDTYRVTMIVTNTNGCSDTVSHTIRIADEQGNITAVLPEGCVPLTVHFGEAPTTSVPPTVAPFGVAPYPYPYPITSYSWNFGDGSPLNTQATPYHTYTITGIFHVHLSYTTSNGCSFTDSTIVEAGTPPVLDSFRAAPTHICNHNLVTFHVYAHGNQPFTYHYNFGDGGGMDDSLSTEQHMYDSPGVFYAHVIVYNYGCPDTNTVHIQITVDSPKASFTHTLSCDSPLTVTCHNTSLGADSVKWDFGDGTYSTLNNPVHTYPTAGTWNLKIIAYNINSGCRDSLTIPVLLVKLTPSFIANDTAVCKDATVHFTSAIAGSPPPLHYVWTVNGAFADTTTNLDHIFTARGFYTIRLTVYDIYNCIDSSVRTNYILVAKPIDSFYAVPFQGCRPLLVNFIDSTKDVGNTTIVSHSWSFGDNTYGTTASQDTTHLYANTGSYNVQEIVTDNLGCKDTLSIQSYINVFHPVPNFTANNLFPCPYSNVVFTSTSLGNIQTFHWDFGDGDTSNASTPAHAYIDTGIFNVKLVVHDQLGCSDSITKIAYIHVTKPTASFTVSDTTGICIPLNAQFNNTSTGAVFNYWNLGNGNTSVAPNPVNSYSVPNIYTVTLIVTNSHGCTDTAVKHVNLYGYAGAFTYSPLLGCKPLLVNFTANVLNIPNIYFDFSDGNIIGPSPSLTASHTYLVAGEYLPKMILKDSSGCTASSQGIDTIKVDEVRTGFKTIPNPICIYDTVKFIDTSHSLFSVLSSWKWTFNNTSKTTLHSPTFYYATAGTFPVLEVVTDSLGCVDSLNRSVLVNNLPLIVASNDTVICIGDSAHLKASGGVSYSWAGTALSCLNCQSPFAHPSVPTHYIVIGVDANGCKNTDTNLVGIKTTTTSFSGKDQQICFGDSVQVADSGAQVYTWYPSTGLSNNKIGNPLASPQNSIKYMIIASSGTCIPDTNYLNVVVHPLPVVHAGSDVTIIENTSTVLQASGTNINSFLWSPALGLSCDTCPDPTAKIQKTTTFKVTAYSLFGCKDSAFVTVRVICDKGQVFVPNTFTPNGDGQNDIFYPRGVGIDKIRSFRIYDRWGGLVFERLNIDLNDETNAWDGTSKGSKPRPDVYVYAIDAICLSGEEISWKGDVTLIR